MNCNNSACTGFAPIYICNSYRILNSRCWIKIGKSSGCPITPYKTYTSAYYQRSCFTYTYHTISNYQRFGKFINSYGYTTCSCTSFNVSCSNLISSRSLRTYIYRRCCCACVPNKACAT